MFTAKVYRVMVGSLSGAMKEVYAAKETIGKWNQQNAESTGKMFMPVEWASEPEVMQNVDVVVGIVDNWVDNPEFVEDCMEVGKRVILFFRDNHNPMNTISGELEQVKEFREKVQANCYCVDYGKSGDFKQALINAIQF